MIKSTITAVVFTVSLAVSASADTSVDISSCDVVHAGGQLQYNLSYPFFLDFTNNGSDTKYVNKLDVDYADRSIAFDVDKELESSLYWTFLDAGAPFELSSEIKEYDYAVQPEATVRAAETGRRPNSDEFWGWRIAKRGSDAQGTAADFDFALRYTLWVDTTNTPNDGSDDVEVVSCVFYGITAD